MNGHDDPGHDLLFEPDALRAEERDGYYDSGAYGPEPDPARCAHSETWPLAGGQLVRCYRCEATLKARTP